ncbi:alpha/beta hydrolase [Embleya sp. NBC_00888]|uniref:alpha/beta fold hydrolase n=1 Tax=Embleya sp. NBC_00888 TaxID=2975960 RepID=UPI00386C18B7|nr:alpha/beta hydrolase [Embleya sp. NBC_00888]
MAAHITTGATLSVPGAELYYEVRGSGPLLLIGESGEGDAGRSVDMVDRLVADHTVVTYDRRGLSRSTLTDPDAPVSIEDHADDVARLLVELTDRPALMLGLSMGGLIGLRVAATRPELLDTLIAHEPVAPWLLPDAEREAHRGELTAIREEHARAGMAGAFPAITAHLGIEPGVEEREPDLTPQPMTARRVANFDFFIGREFPAVVDDTLSLDLLRSSTTRIIPGLGATTGHRVFTRRCAVALAELVGVEAASFPGGHNGNLTHPRAFATGLREVVDRVGG